MLKYSWSNHFLFEQIAQCFYNRKIERKIDIFYPEILSNKISIPMHHWINPKKVLLRHEYSFALCSSIEANSDFCLSDHTGSIKWIRPC